jgi:hypothetical protein
MEGIALLVPGTLLAVAYLLQPLVSENLDAPWDQLELLENNGSTGNDQTRPVRSVRGDQSMVGPDGKRAMTDGGRVCHCCGAVVEGDYLYCGECLTPRV